MADVMPNALATIYNRMPVHVITSFDQLQTSSNVIYLFLDAFYCSVQLYCKRPLLIFDRKFHSDPKTFPGHVEGYDPPPTDPSLLEESYTYSSLTYPLPFTLARNGRFLALAFWSSFVIQEWQFPQSSNSFDGAWVPSFGTKRIGLDEDDHRATILYLAMSNEIQGTLNDSSNSDSDTAETVIVAVGLIRSKFPDSEGFVVAVPLIGPLRPIAGPLHVVVYQWTKGQPPTVLGQHPIVSHEHLQPGIDLPFARNSVQLSVDGKVLSIMSFFKNETDSDGGIFDNSPSQAMVKIFEWNPSLEDWILRQDFVLADTQLLFLASHSLSWDGSVVTIAEASHLRVYHWNPDSLEYRDAPNYEETYRSQEEPNRHKVITVDESLRTVALSGDGSTLVLGSPFLNANDGSVEIYGDDYASPCRYNVTHPRLLHLSFQVAKGTSLPRVHWQVVQQPTTQNDTSSKTVVLREGGPKLFGQAHPKAMEALEYDAYNGFRSFLYQECFSPQDECDTMSLYYKRSDNNAWRNQSEPIVAFFNGQNLTKGTFNPNALDNDEADCVLIVELE